MYRYVQVIVYGIDEQNPVRLSCLFVWCLRTHQPLWVISVRRY